MNPRYTDEELLDHIRNLADKLGKVPTQVEMRDYGDRHPQTYHYRFGSWNNAIEQAGLDPHTSRSSGESSYTDEDLLTHIRELADELGRAPTMREMDDADGRPAPVTFSDRFGSWNEAIEQADFAPQPRGPRRIYSDEELLDHICEFADNLGRTPKYKEMQKAGPPSVDTMQRRFGSWNEAVEAAGLEPNHSSSTGPIISDEELLNDIQRVADELGRTPSTNDMREHGDYSPDTCVKRFDSWNGAVKAACLEPNHTPEAAFASNNGITTADLVTSLQEIALYLGRAPTKEDVETYSMFDPEDYLDRFGSWWVAQSMANVTETDLAMLEDEIEEASP